MIESGDRYEELIQDELDTLDSVEGLNSPKAKRDATIRAVAQAAVDGRSIRSLLEGPAAERPKNVVSHRTYYHKDKPYYHSPEFQEVLSRVENIYRRRELAIKEAADEAARRKRHEENAAFVREGKLLLAEAYGEFKRALVAARAAAKETGLPQEVVLNLTPIQLAQFQKLVLAEERLVFDETPEQKVKLTAEWSDELPGGISEQYADRQLDVLAERLVEEQIARLDRGAFDLDAPVDDEEEG